MISWLFYLSFIKIFTLVFCQDNPDQIEFPYQVSIQNRIQPFYLHINNQLQTDDKEWSHRCGGAIITENHVLTSANCVYHIGHDELSILAGTAKFTSGGRRYLIDWIQSHNNYQEHRNNDIALIKIQNSFKFGPTIAAISFDSEEYIKGGETVVVTGWGYFLKSRNFTNISITLRSVELLTMENQQCAQRKQIVSMNRICTYTDVSHGPCLADSGSPLVNLNRSLLIGIHTFGPHICSIKIPDVYTRVSQYVQWIKDRIK